MCVCGGGWGTGNTTPSHHRSPCDQENQGPTNHIPGMYSLGLTWRGAIRARAVITTLIIIITMAIIVSRDALSANCGCSKVTVSLQTDGYLDNLSPK